MCLHTGTRAELSVNYGGSLFFFLGLQQYEELIRAPDLILCWIYCYITISKLNSELAGWIYMCFPINRKMTLNNCRTLYYSVVVD